MLPKFATVSTSTSLPCIYVVWGGVGQWLDRNPKGTHQVPCKFRKYYKTHQKKKLKNTKKISSKAHWSYMQCIIIFPHLCPFSGGRGRDSFTKFLFIVIKLTEYHGKALNCGRVNFDIFNRQSFQYHPGSGGHCINQFCFVTDGACPHLSYSI